MSDRNLHTVSSFDGQHERNPSEIIEDKAVSPLDEVPLADALENGTDSLLSVDAAAVLINVSPDLIRKLVKQELLTKIMVCGSVKVRKSQVVRIPQVA